MSNTTADNGASSYPGTVIAVNAVISVVVSLGLIWVVNGFDIFYERLQRVRPTEAGSGIGTSFAQGNDIGWLVFMVEAIHAIDVITGIFILLLVFVHWGAFRRLANQMRQPGESPAMPDGGSSAQAADEDGGSSTSDESDADNGGDSQ